MLDRFQYKDEGESPEEFSTCSNPRCKKTLYKGDTIVEHFGYVSCYDLRCVIAMTESKEMIAGEDD